MIKNSKIICGQHPDAASHIDPAHNAMTNQPLLSDQALW